MNQWKDFINLVVVGFFIVAAYLTGVAITELNTQPTLLIVGACPQDQHVSSRGREKIHPYLAIKGDVTYHWYVCTENPTND